MISLVFPVLAGLIHMYIFVLESVLWGTPRANKIFRVTPDTANTVRLFAYNQGFYNLFLAIAIFMGVFFILSGEQLIGRTLVIYSCGSMLAASVVLLSSTKALFRAALIQGLPALIGLILTFV